ncbi:hypothetical protein CMK11_08415 [Candidatus Poribacteria bacterium]|nr:hypothetical protein [Candidatus Poribacteria bacterium]
MSDQDTGARILIVDDNTKNIQVLGTMLREEGYQLNVAQNGVAALKVVETVLPDLILLDVNMPEMDGYETCERLKAADRTRGIPVIFLTARTDTDDIVRGLDLGAVDYLSKPCNRRELLVRVRTHVALRAHEKEAERRAEEAIAERDRNLKWALLGKATPAFVDDYAEDARRIRAQAEWLTRGLDDDDPNKTRAATIERLVEAHLTRLIEIADITQEEMGLELGALDLPNIVDQFVRTWTLEQTPGTEVTIDTDVRYTGAIRADRGRLTNAWRKLVDYAAQLQRESDPGTTPAIQILTYDDNDAIYVGIQSPDPGITAEWREGLFDAEHEHEGEDPKRALDLYYAKRVVTDHAGQLAYRFRQGKSLFAMKFAKP